MNIELVTPWIVASLLVLLCLVLALFGVFLYQLTCINRLKIMWRKARQEESQLREIRSAQDAYAIGAGLYDQSNTFSGASPQLLNDYDDDGAGDYSDDLFDR